MTERGCGLCVPQLDAMRGDAAAASDEWVPGERARATHTSHWRPEGEDGHTELEVIWFQESGTDPFVFLREIVHEVDWRAHCRFIEFNP